VAGLERLHAALSNGHGDTRLSWTNRVVIGLITAASLTAVLETEPVIRAAAPAGLFIGLEAFFVIAFSVEYLLRLAAVGVEPRYAGITGRLRYMVSFWAIVDLLAILPSLLLLGGQESFLLRLARLLRLLRIARLGRFTAALDDLVEALRGRRYELLISVAAAGFLLLVSASILYVLEAEAQPQAFGSIPRTLWWSVATLTTVGYGDVYPVTPLGRIFAGLTAIAGIGLIAMPAGIIAAALSDLVQRRRDG
jgi:voltage-gated potassium channel